MKGSQALYKVQSFMIFCVGAFNIPLKLHNFTIELLTTPTHNIFNLCSLFFDKNKIKSSRKKTDSLQNKSLITRALEN